MIVLCNFILDDPFVGGIDTATLPAGLRARIEAAVAANRQGRARIFRRGGLQRSLPCLEHPLRAGGPLHGFRIHRDPCRLSLPRPLAPAIVSPARGSVIPRMGWIGRGRA